MALQNEAAPQNTQHFYRNLSGFSEFSDIHQAENYSIVPEDWFVLITDICESTQAIALGRYREVNTLGAATISCLQNALGTLHFPFVFGGDGATVLIHGQDIEKAKTALLELQNFAHGIYKFNLRVGAISVADVLNSGHSIEVAKFFMNPKKSIAMFRGGGLSWCDQQIKVNPEKYCLQAVDQKMTDLPGLSCRWLPLDSERGKVMTLLVQPAKLNDDNLIEDVIKNIQDVFGGDLNRGCPVRNKNMKYKSLSQIVADEWKYNKSHLSKEFFHRIFTVFICIWAFRLKLPIFFDAQGYTDQIGVHSDYRKFDDRLRMVIDCTPEEATKIESYLQDKASEGKLFFGVHYSDFSVMTCLVENLQQGGHIHFIDGGQGGYAVAAKNLKNQIASHTTSPYKQAN